MRNNFKRVISLLICFGFVFNFLPITMNAEAEGVVIDFENTGIEQFVISQGSGIEIKTVGSNKVMNILPKVDGVSAYASYNFIPDAGANVEISYDFMINDYLTNGIIIGAISEGVDNFLKIEIKDDALTYKNSTGANITLIENILANKWYNLKLSMDFVNNTYEVYIDNTRLLSNQVSNASYSYVSKEVKLSLSSKYTPGFAIDNFYASNSKTTDKVFIEGESVINISKGFSKTVEYIVKSYDANNEEVVGGEYQCFLKPEGNGVTAKIDGNKLILEISENASEGEFELFAVNGTAVGKKVINIKKYDSVPHSVEILGDGKLVYGYNNNTYSFNVNVIDHLGNSLDSADVYYSLEGEIPDNLNLDSDTGVITVTGELPNNQRLTLKAEINNYPDVFATKSLVLLDRATYAQDEEVFSVLLNHIENVYTYAADIWRGTPLLAMGIDRLTFTPAVWPETQEIEYVPCNMAALANFQKACDAIYLMTGDEKYRQRIDEANLYFSENYVHSNGQPYWGGHACVDLVTGDYHLSNKGMHELKGFTPYMESFYRVNPDFATNVCVTSFSNHILDWYTMDISRHSSYDTVTNTANFYSNTESFTPSNTGFSPAYTINLGFSETLYDFSKLAIDMYRHTGSQNAANAFMKMNDAYWRVASPNKDYWLDLLQNTTAGRKGYPDEAVQGLVDITFGPDGKWWLLDPVPSTLQQTKYGDRYWRARGDDLIDQGYVTEENQWVVRECYYLGSMPKNPQFLYWDFIDAVGEDHPYADIVAERAIRNCANYIRLAYDPANNNFKHILADGTDLTGFVCKRGGYYGGIGQVYNRASGGTAMFPTVALCYSRTLKYPEYKEQADMMWTYLKTYAERSGMGIIGDKAAGDAGTEVDINTAANSDDYILGLVYLYDATGNVQLLDLARAVAKNYVTDFTVDGFIVDNTSYGTVFTGSRQSNGVLILALLEAAIRGELDKMPAFTYCDGFREDEAFVAHAGEQRDSANEFNLWEVPMASVDVRKLVIPDDEIELKVGETFNIEYTIYPDDAGSKGVYVSSNDMGCVTVDVDNRSIFALKPGTTEVTVRSTNNVMAKDTIKVTVTE